MSLVGSEDELVLRHFFTHELCCFDAVRQYDDAVGNRFDLFQLGGDDDDGKPFVGVVVDDLEDLRLRTDIDASARLIEQQDLRLRQETLADDDLLLVAARERENGQPLVRDLDMDVLDLVIDGSILLLVAEKDALGVVLETRK